MNLRSRAQTGVLYALLGVAVFSVDGGEVEVGGIGFTLILKGVAVFLFVLSALYWLSVFLSIVRKAWLTRIDGFYEAHFSRYLAFPLLLMYFCASFIIFARQWAVGLTNLSEGTFRVVFLWFGFAWLMFMGINYIRDARRLGKSARQDRVTTQRRNEWLRKIVDNEIRSHNPPVPFFTWLGLKRPSWRAVLVIACAFGISLFISWILAVLAPSTFLINEAKLRGYYVAMWQVQGSIAAFALPLVIVVIEFSKDLRHVAGRRPEALIRESWIFPIIVGALFGTLRLGIDVYWFLSEAVFIVDVVFVLAGTILTYPRFMYQTE